MDFRNSDADIVTSPSNAILMTMQTKVHKDNNVAPSKKSRDRDSDDNDNNYAEEEEEEEEQSTSENGKGIDDEGDSNYSDDSTSRRIKSEYEQHALEKTNPWTIEEDTKLLDMQEAMGNKWATISKYLPGRNETQTKNRFKSLSRAYRRLWTKSDDDLLLSLRRSRNPKSWEEIMKVFPNRTKNNLKRRYSRLLNSDGPLDPPSLGSPRQALMNRKMKNPLIESKTFVMPTKKQKVTNTNTQTGNGILHTNGSIGNGHSQGRIYGSDDVVHSPPNTITDASHLPTPLVSNFLPTNGKTTPVLTRPTGVAPSAVHNIIARDGTTIPLPQAPSFTTPVPLLNQHQLANYPAALHHHFLNQQPNPRQQHMITGNGMYPPYMIQHPPHFQSQYTTNIPPTFYRGSFSPAPHTQTLHHHQQQLQHPPQSLSTPPPPQQQQQQQQQQQYPFGYPQMGSSTTHTQQLNHKIERSTPI